MGGLRISHTLARALERDLADLGFPTVALDGDDVRRGLCCDLGFGREARLENARRVAEVAVLVARGGLACVVALVSPYAKDRARARSVAAREAIPFLEVFVDAPLSVCERRDPKGLYQLARAGDIPHFTGVSAPYEVPCAPDVHVRTDLCDPASCASHIVMHAKATIRV